MKPTLARISHRRVKRSAGGAGDGGVFDPTRAESGSAARRARGGEKTPPAPVHRALQPRGGEKCGLVELSEGLEQMLGLSWKPVGVRIHREGPDSPPDGFETVSAVRYCQALMFGRRGRRVRLEPGGISCPAAASAFGFRTLPAGLARISHTLPAAAADAPAGTALLPAAPPATCLEHASAPPWSKRRADRRLRALATKVCEICGLASGQGLVGFGIVGDPAAGKTMFDGMARLELGTVTAIDLAPLAAFDALPDVVVVEDRVERLMWFLLAEVNHSGGARVPADTAVLQATCVDVTLVPYTQGRLNFSFGCYGCREATDIEPGEAVVGFPGALLPRLVANIERLANKAIPRSRAKRPYAALVGPEGVGSPFGGDACT